MKKVKYHDTFVYVDDTPLDEKETGVLIKPNASDELEKTLEVDVDLINDMINNSIGDNHE